MKRGPLMWQHTNSTRYRTEDSECDSESDSESESETTYLPYVIPSHAACYEIPLHG